jgi:hypothetical protein
MNQQPAAPTAADSTAGNSVNNSVNNSADTNTDTQRRLLTDSAGLQSAATGLLADCRYSVTLLLDRLDSDWLDIPDLSRHMTRISRHAGARTDIRILVKSVEGVQPGRHPLPGLARKLASIVQVRQLQTQPANEQMNVMIGDRDKLLFIHNGAIAEGFVSTVDGPRILALLEEFNLLWNLYGKPVDALRKLHL